MPSSPIHVPHRKLETSYVPVFTKNDQDPVLGVVHGFGHKEVHFSALSDSLAMRNIATVRLNFNSAHRNVFARNAIGLGEYVTAMDSMVDDFQQRYGRKIDGLIGHSQGGLLTEEWLQRQSDDTLLQILLAPIPQDGAKKAVAKVLLHRAGTFGKILLSFFTKKGMSGLTPQEISHLFFDGREPDEVIKAATNDMTHTPLLVFLQDILRKYVRPTLQRSNRRTLLVESSADALFPSGENDDLHEVFANMEAKQINGGHDFFVLYPEAVAQLIVEFLATEKS